VHDALELARIADVTGVMSLETIKGSRRPFEERIAAARPHPGAIAAAAALWRLTEGSEIVESHRDCHKVQDAYSFRCMPQVHGATRDGLGFARRVLETEMSAATDNPLVFVDGGESDIVSGGNFHGQPVAMALDLAPWRWPSWAASPSGASSRSSTPPSPGCRPSSPPRAGCTRATCWPR
jgi:histidine ammonia-lyase